MPDPTVHPAITARIAADLREIETRAVRAAKQLKDALAIKPVSEAHADAVATLIEHKQNELLSLDAQAAEARVAAAPAPTA